MSFSPAKLGLSWATEPSSSPPAASGPLGEPFSGLEGGTTAGLPSGTRVGIVSVSKADLGTAVCGGVVGSGGKKMCVRDSCSIAAHQAQKGKVDLERVFLGNEGGLLWNVDEACFIVASTDTEGAPAVVHVDPSLPSVFLPASEASEYLQRKQTTESWKMIFESLCAVHANPGGEDKTDNDGEVVVEKILKADTEAYCVTPKKRKGRVLEESPLQDFEMPIKDLPDLSGLEPKSALREVLRTWEDVRYNFDFLAAVTASTKTRSHDRANELEDQVDELEIRIACLRSLLGNRTEILTLGTESICTGLQGLFNTVESLEAYIAGLSEWRTRVKADLVKTLSATVDASISNQVFSGEYHDKWIMPLCRLLQAISLSHTDPGDKLFARLDSIEAKVKGLEDRSVAAGGGGGTPFPPAPSWPAWPLASGTPAPPPPLPIPPTPTAPPGAYDILVHQVTSLRAEVEQLKAQQESEAVKVGGVLFKSLDQTAAWLAGSGAEPFIYLFVDAMSLLSMSDVVKIDESESARSRANTARISDPNPEYTQYVASFSLEVPPLFGRTKDLSNKASSKALAAIPNFEAWDTGLGADGAKHRLADLLTDGHSQIMTDIGLNIPGEAGLVAKELLINATLFWGENSNFMSSFTTECINRSEASELECWQLTSHCERAIFKLLRNARKIGQRRVPAQMLWGTLQANRVAKELITHKFQGHPNVSIILHQHLIDHSVPVSRFNTLQVEVTTIRKELAAVKQTADKGLSTANNASKKK